MCGVGGRTSQRGAWNLAADLGGESSRGGQDRELDAPGGRSSQKAVGALSKAGLWKMSIAVRRLIWEWPE